MDTHKSCSFIGHRTVDNIEKIEIKTKNLVERLILEQNVSTFIFGSRSDFDNLCQKIVSEFKIKYPHIKRIIYTCKSESCVLESERDKIEKLYSFITNSPQKLLCVDEEYEFKNKYMAGKASYIERNQSMIDNSDFCIIYYRQHYIPKQRKNKTTLSVYQPKSGTKLAFEYIKRKGKPYFNIADFDA